MKPAKKGDQNETSVIRCKQIAKQEALNDKHN